MAGLTELARQAREAAGSLRCLPAVARNGALAEFARGLEEGPGPILEANRIDLEEASGLGMAPALLDRLALSKERLSGIAEGIRQVVALPDPLGVVLEERTLRSGIRLKKVTVPYGVIGVIFESRPNVAADCAALCLKAGSACVLKGGREAYRSGRAIIDALKAALASQGLPLSAVSLADNPSHAEVQAFIADRGSVDLLIPRGGRELIRAVVSHAGVPVIETGAGVCHVYVDESADLAMAERIVINAKCSRPAVCNAMETLLVNERIAAEFLPRIVAALRARGVVIHADGPARKIVAGLEPAGPDSWRTEYDSLEMNLRVVGSVEEAIRHIEKYGTHHSECIVTELPRHVELFMNGCDSACVYHNASTRFTDGFEFGLGAEIGISTQKLGARGPMGLRELVSYAYHLEGQGEIRQ